MNKHQRNPVEGIAIAVAGAWKECPNCKGLKAVMEKQLSAGQEGILWVEIPCPTCKGTGRVFALDPLGTIGVRVDCPNSPVALNKVRPGDALWHKGCSACQDRGWVATNDVWVLLEAVDDATRGLIGGKLPGAAWRANMERAAVRGDRESFFRALAKCLVAQGYTLGGE
ncbi:hypothetical protein LCGC14_0853180 [marine sediment metagenome]|uniref:CR-type domain-containing protein n=1 Tax=marine sediment metagenome TaxID=412755 RepID=A0A0F9RU71_9ZZZZ